MLRIVVLVMFAAFLFAAQSVYAQSAVNIRSGIHEDYTRLVFDWPEAGASYDVIQLSSRQTEIIFDRNVSSSDDSAVKLSNSKHIQGFQVLSRSPLRVRIDHVSGADLRPFIILNRIVVDVRADGIKNSIPKEEETESSTASSEETRRRELLPEDKQKTFEKAQKKAAKNNIDVQLVGDAPPPSVELTETTTESDETEADIFGDQEKKGSEDTFLKKAAAEKIGSQPHKIVVSATTAFNLAAFMRSNRLWIVMDKPEYYVQPQIRGPLPEMFNEFKRIDVTEGTAFYLDLPEDKTFYAAAEGGGLTWNIVLGEEPPLRKKIWPRRDVDRFSIRGGLYLAWDLPGITRITKFEDPFLGDEVHVAFVQRPDIYAGVSKEFTDVMLLDSVVGAAFVPKVDNLEITNDEKELRITRPEGLALMEASDVRVFELRDDSIKRSKDIEDVPEESIRSSVYGRIFKFDQWRLGGAEMLRENQEVLMKGLIERDKNGQAQDLVSLAKLEVSNARGAEAVGLLKLAGEEFKPFRRSPEYLALLGAAYTFNNQFDVAFRVFRVPQLDEYEEIKFWRAYTLAELGDWNQAGDVVPDNVSYIQGYPRNLRLPLSIELAEVFLRKGDAERAGQLLKYVENESENLEPHFYAGLTYLRGELMRQRGNIEGALDTWFELTKHNDDFFRTRARLALTNLRYDQKEITIDKAIDNLESLRFAWRGDDLEMTINFRLGQLYMEKGSHIKGLAVLREAVSFSQGTAMAQGITAFMRKEFDDLFLGEKSDQISPLRAAMLYEEFRELTPAGDRGDELLQSLAEKLIDVDLLDRAINILRDQVKHRTAGVEQIQVALRLAGIQLINNDNAEALQTLDLAERPLNSIPILESVPYRRDVNLLRARAYSNDGRSREALILLNNMKQDDDVVRLKADIAWKAGHWNDAAEALEDLVGRYDIRPNDSINERQADMILNWTVALSLSGNRHVLSNVRTQYGTQMETTPKGRLFEVVTRPRQNAVLADRETISQIVSEVDIFNDFLESYRAP